jgi:hypothetical protein
VDRPLRLPLALESLINISNISPTHKIISVRPSRDFGLCPSCGTVFRRIGQTFDDPLPNGVASYRNDRNARCEL